MNLSRIRVLTGAVAMAVLLMSGAPVVKAQTIYRSVDENGVVSFSDVETDGSRQMQVITPPVRESAQEEQRALIEQQLAVAKSLEESRLARDAARTRRLEAVAATQPKTVYYREDDQRYLGGSWGWGWGHRPGHPGYPIRPGRPPGPAHPIQPPLRPPSRPVPFPPQNFN